MGQGSAETNVRFFHPKPEVLEQKLSLCHMNSDLDVRVALCDSFRQAEPVLCPTE